MLRYNPSYNTFSKSPPPTPLPIPQIQTKRKISVCKWAVLFSYLSLPNIVSFIKCRQANLLRIKTFWLYSNKCVITQTAVSFLQNCWTCLLGINKAALQISNSAGQVSIPLSKYSGTTWISVTIFIPTNSDNTLHRMQWDNFLPYQSRHHTCQNVLGLLSSWLTIWHTAVGLHSSLGTLTTHLTWCYFLPLPT